MKGRAEQEKSQRSRYTKNKAGLRLVSLRLGQTGGEHKEPAAGLSWGRKGPGALSPVQKLLC